MTMITNANFLGKKISFIQHIRAAFGIGLKEAKEIADQFNMNFVETNSVGYSAIHDPIAYSLINADSRDFIEVDQPKDKTLKTKVKELTKEAIDLGEYSVAQSLIDILK